MSGLLIRYRSLFRKSIVRDLVVLFHRTLSLNRRSHLVVVLFGGGVREARLMGGRQGSHRALNEARERV